MNLQLDLQPRKNPKIARHTKAGVMKNNKDGLSLINWFQRPRTLHDSIFMPIQELCSIDVFLDSVDREELAKVTAMEYSRKFNDKVAYLERYFGSHMRYVTEMDYRFETKKNFDWKNGIYDFLKAYANEVNGFSKKNSGIDYFFKRTSDGHRQLRNLHSRMIDVESLRKDCKKNIGKVIEDIDEVIEEYENNIKTIQDNTVLANQMSPYYEVYNCINYQAMDTEPPYEGFLNLELFTIVHCQPNLMQITNTSNDSLGTIPTPEMYIVFARPFSSVLLGKSHINHFHINANVIGYSHPYIASNLYYDITNPHRHGNTYGVMNKPWSASVCLSSFADDIRRPLAKNDYISFLMAISSWNNIYNNDSTNPHNGPGKIFQEHGIPSNSSEDDIQKYKSLFGYNERGCYDGQMYKHHQAEDDQDIARYNSDIDLNYYQYTEYVINECDDKQCPLRNNCSKYLHSNFLIHEFEHLEEMVESIVGHVLVFEEEVEDIPWVTAMKTYRRMADYYNYLFNCWNRQPHRITNFFIDEMESYSYHTKPRKVAAEVIDDSGEIADRDGEASQNDVLAEEVARWTQQINSQGR